MHFRTCQANREIAEKFGQMVILPKNLIPPRPAHFFLIIKNLFAYYHFTVNQENGIMMIKSFKNRCASDLHSGLNSKASRKLPRYLHELAGEKLDILEAAQELEDLKVPPGNRLEQLKGDLRDRYSLRINDQWRIVFAWYGGDAEEVEIIDYH
jgi:toxin HigB-1